jgi:hypothetical protein
MRFQSAETLVNSVRKLNITSREPALKGNEKDPDHEGNGSPKVGGGVLGDA